MPRLRRKPGRPRAPRDLVALLERERALDTRLIALRQEIGAAIRSERQRKGLPLALVTRPSAVSPSDASLLERGRTWNRDKAERLALAVIEAPPTDPASSAA